MNYADYVMVAALLVVALAALSIETQLRAIRRLIEDQILLDVRRHAPVGSGRPIRPGAEPPATARGPETAA